MRLWRPFHPALEKCRGFGRPLEALEAPGGPWRLARRSSCDVKFGFYAGRSGVSGCPGCPSVSQRVPRCLGCLGDSRISCYVLVPVCHDSRDDPLFRVSPEPTSSAVCSSAPRCLQTLTQDHPRREALGFIDCLLFEVGIEGVALNPNRK